ncbi:MAG: CoA transferase [Pararhodobacter sp.]|nr:CoA transferase [Pararhodobacter sp.]
MTAALDGIRVLDLGRLGPSAMASMYLADFGAEVISITAAPAQEMPEPDGDFWSFPAQMALIGRSLNRNKHSLSLNLKAQEDHAAFLKMVAGADVVIDDFRPGTAERLGIGFDRLSALNPRLIGCAMSGYGQTGPLADQGGHDINFIARAGLLDLIGNDPDTAPVIPLFFLSDFGGAAMHALSGILLALLARERTGRGQFIDIAFLDSALGLANPLAWHVLNGGAGFQRGRLLYSGSYPHYALYPCKGGGYLAVGCFEPWLWARFCAEIGLPDCAEADLTDEAAAADVRTRVAAVLATRRAEDWDAMLGPRNVCVCAVQSLADLLGGDHPRLRGLLAETRHPRRGPERHLGNPIALSETPARIYRAAPDPGQDSAALRARLSLSKQPEGDR